MTLSKFWRRALQGVALIAGLAIIQGQASCQARTGGPAPPSTPDPGNPTTPSPSPQPPPTVPPETTPVTGDERIAWDEEVPAGTRSGSMTYAAYLDGIRVDFPGVSCNATSDTLHECSAPLPRMERGPHTLRLAAIGPSDNPIHGPRSRVLSLVKVDPGTVLPVQAAQAGAARASDAFAVDVIADGTGAIADIAVSPAGAPFVAELNGRILTTDGNGLVEALQVRDVTRRGGLGLMSIALHPDFEQNRLVYFAYAADSKSGPVWRLARGRELNGRIGEVAVLIDGEPIAAGASAVIRFGPDRQLYAALGADAAAPSRAGGYSGRLLRLSDDGGRATNNADGSPIVDTIAGAPLGLTWAQEIRLLETRAGDRHTLVISQGAKTLSRYAWEAGRRPAGLAFTANNGGWLYIATLDRGLQRIKWPPPKGVGQGDASIASEYTGVRAVAVAPDGTIYFGTANSASDRGKSGTASGKNYVIRLRPR